MPHGRRPAGDPLLGSRTPPKEKPLGGPDDQTSNAGLGASDSDGFRDVLWVFRQV